MGCYRKTVMKRNLISISVPEKHYHWVEGEMKTFRQEQKVSRRDTGQELDRDSGGGRQRGMNQDRNEGKKREEVTRGEFLWIRLKMK